MSISYWVAKKLGVFIILFYVAVMGVLVVSYYHTGIADARMVARYYPPGVYAGSNKYQTVRKIYGVIPEEIEKLFAVGSVQIVSYSDTGAVIRHNGKENTVSVEDVIRYLANKNSGKIEAALFPLHEPLNALLKIHLNILHRIEMAAGGDEEGYRRIIIPKIAISCAYLGLVLFIFFILRRVDCSLKEHQGGYSLIYGAFIFWPIAIIVVSLAGTNVLDVVRHLPDSYYFLHWYIAAGWAAMLAWPFLVAFLSVIDIIHSFLRVDLNQTCAHLGVLAAGIISIPLVTIGVLFALLAATLYIGYRAVRKLVLSSKTLR